MSRYPLGKNEADTITSKTGKKLSEITEKEQLAVEALSSLEKKREGIMGNMRIVLNRKGSALKLEELINLMDKQPETKAELIELKKALKETLENLRTINGRNEKLINQSLEISEYHLNMIRSSRGYIGNNYTRKAGQFGQFDMPMMSV